MSYFFPRRFILQLGVVLVFTYFSVLLDLSSCASIPVNTEDIHLMCLSNISRIFQNFKMLSLFYQPGEECLGVGPGGQWFSRLCKDFKYGYICQHNTDTAIRCQQFLLD